MYEGVVCIQLCMWHSQHNDSDIYLIWHALMNETHVWWT